GVQVEDDHPCPGRGEAAADRFADPLRPAGDNGDTVVQPKERFGCRHLPSSGRATSSQVRVRSPDGEGRWGRDRGGGRLAPGSRNRRDAHARPPQPAPTAPAVRAGLFSWFPPPGTATLNPPTSSPPPSPRPLGGQQGDRCPGTQVSLSPRRAGLEEKESTTMKPQPAAKAKTPAPRKEAPQPARRDATPGAARTDFKVRYYNRMKLQRVYPLVVELPRGRGTAPPAGVGVTVRPIIPGAHVTPLEQKLDVAQPGAQATFSVTPLACGRLSNARVEVHQPGRAPQQIPLRMKSVTQRLTWL